MEFKVIKFNKKRGNIVLSRRAILSKKKEENLRDETLGQIQEGMIVKGIVKNITDYGAFIDLGGVDGLLHITDMSWGRVKHPSNLSCCWR
jgi:small subunit ribosomal protein S1